MELRRTIIVLFTYALLGLACTKAAEVEERSAAKLTVNGEEMSEGKSQTESESLVDGNEMNQQVSNMADVFGSAGRRTYDDTQLEEFASIDEVWNDELNEQTPKKRVRRWFGSTSRSGSSSSSRRTSSSRRSASSRRTFSGRRRKSFSRRRTSSRRTFSSRRRTLSSRRRTISSRRRALTSRRRAFWSRRRTVVSRRRALSTRRRALSTRRRALSTRRRALSTRRRARTSRRWKFNKRRRTSSSGWWIFHKRRRAISSRSRTVCKRQTSCNSNTEAQAKTEGTSGKDVVGCAVSKVEKVLGKTHGLLMRTAIVESHYGRNKNTYRQEYYGGVFQVDKKGFKDTQDVTSHRKNLPGHLKIIKKEFNIDWQKVEWKDLQKPLYSAIAARLVYLNKPAKIPKDLKKQAEYWKKYYNSEHKNAKGTVEKFLKEVKATDTTCG